MQLRLGGRRARRAAVALALALAAALGTDLLGGCGGLGPPTWSAMYEDYWGPSGSGACGTSGCHSRPSDAGAMASNFMCVDKESCYASMTGASHLVTPDDVNDPAGAALFRSLRQPGGAGKMPQNSNFEFQSDDIQRIQDWIAKGAQDD